MASEPSSSGASPTSSDITDITSSRSPMTPDSASMINHVIAAKQSAMMKPRRASVAVWADDKLMSMVSQIENGRVKKESNRKKAFMPTIEMVEIDGSQSSVQTYSLGKFNQLTNQIVLNILGYCTFSVLVKMKMVNKGFISLIDDSRTELGQPCRNIDLSSFNKKINDGNVSSAFEICISTVHNLSLKNCWSLTDAAFDKIASSFENLSSLNCSSVWEITDNGLLNIARNSPNLQRIDLSNCRKITDVGLEHLLDNCTQLKHIVLSYCKNLTMKTFGHDRWSQMETINLQRCTNILDGAFAHWLRKQEEQGTIYSVTELILSDCSFLTDAAIKSICLTCPYLKVFSLYFCCGLTEACIESLKTTPFIRTLDFSFCGNAITDSSLALITKQLPELQYLYIRGCVQVSNASVAVLREMTCLKGVNVSQCKGITETSTLPVTKENRYDL